MNDDELDRLVDSWQIEGRQPDAMLENYRAARRRHRVRAALAAMALLFLLAALAFAVWKAFSSGELRHWILVGAFLLAVPSTLHGTAEILARPRERCGMSAIDLLHAEQDRLATQRRVATSARHCAYILLIATIALWTTAAFDGSATSDLLGPSVAWLATAGTLLVWQHLRRHRIQEMARAVDLALSEFRETQPDC